MALDPSRLVAVSYPMAIHLCRQLNGGTVSDDILCRGGWPGPVAIELARQMRAGVGNVEQLRQCGFCSSDAILVAAQITTGFSAYWGPIATHTVIPDSTTTAGNKQFQFRTRHVLQDDITALKFKFPVFACAGGAGSRVEAGIGSGTFTINAGVATSPSAGTRITFAGGATSATGADTAAGSIVISDVIPFVASKGTVIYCQGLFSHTVGLYYRITPYDPSRNEAFVALPSGLSDPSLSGAITNDGIGATYGPCAVLGLTRKPTVWLAGTSRIVGVMDSYSDASGNIGELERSIGAGIGYTNAAVQGDTLNSFLASGALRLSLAADCTHAICEYAINDIDVSLRTTTQLLADYASLKARLPAGMPLFGVTASPHANGGNTAPNNSTANTTRIAWNGLLRGGSVPSLAGFFDNASVTEATLNGGLWVTGYSTDFLHANNAGNLAIQAAGVINPAVIHR